MISTACNKFWICLRSPENNDDSGKPSVGPSTSYAHATKLKRTAKKGWIETPTSTTYTVFTESLCTVLSIYTVRSSHTIRMFFRFIKYTGKITPLCYVQLTINRNHPMTMIFEQQLPGLLVHLVSIPGVMTTVSKCSHCYQATSEALETQYCDRWPCLVRLLLTPDSWGVLHAWHYKSSSCSATEEEQAQRLPLENWLRKFTSGNPSFIWLIATTRRRFFVLGYSQVQW